MYIRKQVNICLQCWYVKNRQYAQNWRFDHHRGRTVIAKTPALVPSLHQSLSVKSGPRKKWWGTTDRVMGSQGWLIHVGREGCLCGLIQHTSYCVSNWRGSWCWFWQTDVRKHSASGSCLWGCIAGDQSVLVLTPVQHRKPHNGHVSIRTGPHSNGRMWLGLMNYVFFYTPVI